MRWLNITTILALLASVRAQDDFGFEDDFGLIDRRDIEYAGDYGLADFSAPLFARDDDLDSAIHLLSRNALEELLERDVAIEELGHFHKRGLDFVEKTLAKRASRGPKRSPSRSPSRSPKRPKGHPDSPGEGPAGSPQSERSGVSETEHGITVYMGNLATSSSKTMIVGGVSGCSALFFVGANFITAAHIDPENEEAETAAAAREARAHGQIQHVLIRAPYESVIHNIEQAASRYTRGAPVAARTYDFHSGRFFEFTLEHGSLEVQERSMTPPPSSRPPSPSPPRSHSRPRSQSRSRYEL